jgi:hypothetical protein
MAAGKAMAAAMSTSVATAMPASVATATSAGGRKGWGKGYRSADGCGGGDSDHGLSRHGGVILSGHQSTRARC